VPVQDFAVALPNEANPATGFTITITPGTPAGADLWVSVTSRNHTATDAYPTVVDNEAGSVWTMFAESVDDSRRDTQWHRKATADTAGKTITVAGCLNSASGGLKITTGGGAGNPATNVSEMGFGIGVFSRAGFTPDFANSMICMVVSAFTNTAIGGQSCTNPGALDEDYEHLSTAGGDCATAFASRIQTGGPTATGNFTWTLTSDVGPRRVTVWAIRPGLNDAFAQLTLTGSANGQVLVSGSHSKTIPFASAGAGTVFLAGAGQAQLILTGSSAGGVLVQAAGTAQLTVTGQASSTIITTGHGTALLQLLSSGVGKVLIQGAGAAVLQLIGVSGAELGALFYLIGPRKQHKRVLRLEIYSDYKYAAGICLGILRYWIWGTLNRHRGLNCIDTWTVAVPGRPWFVAEDLVLRVVFNDGTVLERRITEVGEGLAESGDIVTTIKAEHPIIDWTTRAKVEAKDAEGRVTHKFAREGITGRQHMVSYITKAMRDKGYTWWDTGIVEQLRQVRHTYNQDTPRQSLEELRNKLEGEIQMRDDGVSKFYVDIVAQTNQAHPPIPARWTRNVGQVSLNTNLLDQATVMYPVGTEYHDQPGTPAQARWRVRATARPDAFIYRVYLEDLSDLGFGPIRFAGQLLGKRLIWRAPSSHSLWSIPIVADALAGQYVDLDPSVAPWWSELMPGTRVGIRAADGSELTFVEIPLVPRLVMDLQRTDLPGTNNLLSGSTFRHWLYDEDGLAIRPEHWQVTGPGEAIISRNTLETYWETAGSSVLLETLVEHGGIVGEIEPLWDGTAGNPSQTATMRAWIEEGQLYLQLELFDQAVNPTRTLVLGHSEEEDWAVTNDASPKDWWTDLAMPLNVATAVKWWNEAHPEAPITNDFWYARLSLRQRGTRRVKAYVDRLQLTETEDAAPFAEGSGGAHLWEAGQQALVNYGGPAESLALSYRDIRALNGGQLDPDDMEPGVQLAVRVDPLRLTRTTRVQFVDTQEDDKLVVNVQLEDRQEELTKRLTRGLG
jgi:hypothetical protein